MTFVWNTVVTAINGETEVESVHLKNIVTGEERDLAVSAAFIFIGQTPNSGFLRGVVEMDAGGHVLVNEWMETGVSGVYAAGDLRANSARQVVSAAGDGATAAIRADHYISDNFRE
jgi:thioredoxin reductase (NADPH)